MVAKMERLESVANNLANVNTHGYKKTSQFQTLLSAQSAPASRQAVPRTFAYTTYVDFSQGDLEQTGNPLDVALQGPGFFVLETPTGVAFTRNGSLKLNEDQLLVSSHGYPVMGEGGAIELRGWNVDISEKGDVYAEGQLIDRLRVVDFEDRSLLANAGATLFRLAQPSTVEASPAKEYTIAQGFLESSNVNPLEQMIEMITLSREFEAVQRVLRQSDETLGKAANEVGRVR